MGRLRAVGAAGVPGHGGRCRREPLLAGDHIRFPSGMKALGDYVHAAGLSFAMYTAESPHTCGGFPASANNEVLDAKTFASWGVDYLKASPRE